MSEKKKASDEVDGEEEREADETEESGSEDDDASESDTAETDDEDSDGEHSEADDSDEDADEERSERDDSDEDEADRDEAASRVAKSLGVDEDEEKDEAEVEAPPPNRAERRKKEAVKRRKRKARARKGDEDDGDAGEDGDDDDGDLPRDRNKRAKELLRRRKQSQDDDDDDEVAQGLTAGEIVDDNLARAGAGAIRFAKSNAGLLQVAAVAALILAVGGLYYLGMEEEASGEVSDALYDGVSADIGRVQKEDPRTEEEKKTDPRKLYTTVSARTEDALNKYNKVVDTYSDRSGPAALAKLGQAGIYLQRREWGPALEAYNAVAGSSLGQADEHIRASALEGAGFALEGKEDWDGATAKFKELEAVAGFETMAKYHQARMLIAKGDDKGATEMLKAIRKELMEPGWAGKEKKYLQGVVDEALRTLDPTAVPKARPLGGPKGATMTAEEMQKVFEQMKKRAEEAQEGDGHEGHGH